MSASLPSHVVSVALDKASRLINHGPTVFVCSAHAGQRNVMAAAWNMPVDFSPPKLALVIDHNSLTHRLVQDSGHVVLCVPGQALANACFAAGSVSGRDFPDAQYADKFEQLQLTTFNVPSLEVPLVAGCSAWLACQIIPEPALTQTHDLFLCHVTQAWADERAFHHGRWREVQDIPQALRPIHHIGGGQFWSPGHAVQAEKIE